MSLDDQPDSIEAWQARGFTRHEACVRWSDARDRDRLNRLNAARAHVLTLFYSPAINALDARALQVLDDAAYSLLYDLRKDVAGFCEPWFRVVK